jgi:hypothetical protein
MDMAEMMERLLAKMDASQVKADETRKEMLAVIKANEETTAKMEANMGSLRDALKSDIKKLKFNREETMACQEKTEARLKEDEPASEDMTPEVARDQDVPREDAAVMPVRGLRKQAAGRCEEPEKLNQGICGSREKLAAARRKVSHCATVAWCRRNVLRQILTHGSCGLRKEVTAAGMRITRCAGHRRTGRIWNDVEQETQNRRTEQNQRWRGPEWNNDLRNRGLQLQLRSSKRIMNPTVNNIKQRNPRQRALLGSGGSRKKDIRVCDISREKTMVTTKNGKEVFERTTRLGIAKRSAGSLVGLRTIKKWTQWRGRPPPKRKK